MVAMPNDMEGNNAMKMLKLMSATVQVICSVEYAAKYFVAKVMMAVNRDDWNSDCESDFCDKT